MIKHKDSHMDHGFTQAQWDYIFETFASRDAFFIETIELPEHLSSVLDGLYGPCAGDPPVLEADVYYAPRGDRAWPSRLVRQPKRPTRFVRVIAGPHADDCGGCEGKGTLPVETLHHEWKDAVCPECQGSGKGTKYACILYTAYGVMRKDAPAAPREPGDIRREMKALEEQRRRLEYRGEEHDKVYAQLEALRPKREESDAYWSQHGLAWEGDAS